jgi:SAM-dependent methyltransferase
MFDTVRHSMRRILRGTDRSSSNIQPPANFQRRDASQEKIASDVDYAVQVAHGYLELIRANGDTPNNHVVFEMGPGINFGTMMVLACYGARPIVADRFLASWDDNYHPLFYAALRARLRAERPEVDPEPIERILRAGIHDPSVINCLPEPGEHLGSIASDSVDIAVSNAVLEHLADPPKVFAELARITRPGGLGLHQVDFRDHRSFATPLEYLLLDRDTFARTFDDCHGECGTQWRPHEYTALFTESGFDVLNFDGNMRVDEAYLDSFMPRLRAARGSPYQNCSRDQLTYISGRFHLRRSQAATG